MATTLTTPTPTTRVRAAFAQVQELSAAEIAELQRLLDEAIPAPDPERFQFPRPAGIRITALGERAVAAARAAREGR